MFNSSDASGTRLKTPILLDGGLASGTTLEDVFLKDITHPLWSAKLVDTEDDVIVAAHLAFLRAGSRVILASTYQAAYETFSRTHYTTSEAERLMLKSVDLAIKAREYYEKEQSLWQPNGSRPRAKIALSLGPYGATLETAAEFTGIYPSPYGPSHVTPSSKAGQLEGQGPLAESDDASQSNALAAFHFSRLLVYARNADIWNAIDLLAFETIPLVTEARGIRIAVARLEEWFQEATTERKEEVTSRMKTWYISFVFPGPGGNFIQVYPVINRLEETQILGSSDGSTKERTYTAYEIAQAALTPGNDLDQPNMSIPDAIGVNCTPCDVISPIIEGFAAAVRDMSLQTKYEPPWLVLCPNGGMAYDPVEHTWMDNRLVSQGQILEEHGEGGWAKGLAELIQGKSKDHSAMDLNSFGGLLVGGCCKTGPNEIKALKSEMEIL
ncbi:Homocysteine S-methyltransferase [Gautieria morchelliformis]|nr:Homocysteine S-methyltransferase [Gautieria morchelliformis]